MILILQFKECFITRIKKKININTVYSPTLNEFLYNPDVEQFEQFILFKIQKAIHPRGNINI